MTQPTGTYSSYDAVGNREDLIDMIYDVSPTETPIMSAIGRGKAKATAHEWQTDALASASTSNAVIEGDDATNDSMTATSRLKNYTQLMDKVIQVTSAQEAVNKAGRSSEMEYQLGKAMKEIKRDIEATIANNQAYGAGTDTSARQMGGLGCWLTTNTSFDSTGTTAGADPTTIGSAARTDGSSTRQFTEDLLLDVHQACFAAGGNPSLLVVGPYNARRIAGFSGGSTRIDRSEDKKLYNAVDVYISPFGELKVTPDRFSRARDAWLLDPEYAGLNYLQEFKTEDLAKTGHSVRKMLSVELTLKVGNEAAHGGVFDLASS
jgi:hypothetical protein